MDDPLYRKQILRLAADAAGAGRLAQPHGSATRHNPACGDRITVEVAVADGRVTALAHHTIACVLTQASAAILGADAVGLNRAEMASLTDRVRGLLAGGGLPPAPFDAYGAFDGLADHKARHRCVLMPLEAALEALESLELAEPGA
jgi:NifU-like protein involved in Fe-S cluster formation